MEPDWISEYYGKLPESEGPKREEKAPVTPPPLPPKKKESKTRETQNENVEIERVSPTSNTFVFSDPELKSRFDSMMKQRDEVERAVDELYLKSGLDRRVISNYLSNPQNFSPEQWKWVSREKKRLEDTIWKIVGLEGKRAHEMRQQVKKAHEHKGKMLGGRKRWISMH